MHFLPNNYQSQNIYITNNKLNDQIEHIDFSDALKYMTNLMYLIEKITVNNDISNIVVEFITESKNLRDGFFNPDSTIKSDNIDDVEHKQKEPIKQKQKVPIKFLVGFFVSILLVGSAISGVLYIFNNSAPQRIICSDLVFPKFYLQRNDILKQMDKLLSAPNKINIIALVGMRGVGKTTVALQYADTQDASIIWKINAETPASIMLSLESLAYSICTTTLDKNEFYKIQKIKDTIKKENMIRIFLKNKVPLYKKWIIIYDNVTNISDIQIFTPHDIKTWGSEGKIIVTTTNSHIINNNYFSKQNIIYIPELSEQEKIELYTHILNITNADYEKDPNIKILLNAIPPFPLDVLQAAYYIRSTGIKPSKYIEYIKKKDDNFLKLEKSISNNISDNTSTRNNIIEFSLEVIQQQQEEAKSLLLLLSLINVENIPKNLLVAYKSEIVVNKFLQNMQIFSLIKEENNNDGIMSLHKSIQTNFLKNLDKGIYQKDYDDIALFLVNFVEQELQEGNKNKKLLFLIPHLEALLDYYDSFSSGSVFAIRNSLGNLYNQCANDSPKAIEILEYARLVALQESKRDSVNLIKNSIYLNDIYYKLGDFKKADNFFLEAEKIYKKQPKSCISPYLDYLLQKARKQINPKK